MLHNQMHTGKKLFCFCQLPAAHAHTSINKPKLQQVSNPKHPLLLHMLFMRLQSNSTLSSRTSGVIFKTDIDRGKNEVPTYFILQKLFRLNWCLFLTSALLIQHLWITAGSRSPNSSGISSWKMSSHCFMAYTPLDSPQQQAATLALL